MVNEHVFDKLNSELENIHQLYKSTVENNLTPNDVRKTINNEVGKGTFPDGYDHNKFGQYVGDQHGVSPDNTSIKLDAAGDHTPYNKTLPKKPASANQPTGVACNAAPAAMSTAPHPAKPSTKWAIPDKIGCVGSGESNI